MKRSLAISFAVAAACGGSATPSPAPVVESDVPAAEPARIVEVDGVEVLHPGSEPRRRLAFDLAVGATVRKQMSMELTRQDTHDGVDQPAIDRIALADFSLTVVEVDGGWYEILYEFDELSLNGSPMEPAIDGFRVQLSPTGEVTEPSDGSGLGFAKQMTFQLPRAPLGLGARWSEEMGVVTEAMTLDVVRHNELTALDGTIATIETSYEVGRGATQVASPKLGPGQTMWLTAMNVFGTSVIELDLSAPPPERMMVRAGIRMRGEIRDGPVVAATFGSSWDTVFSIQPLEP